jgi:hypothetical protein
VRTNKVKNQKGQVLIEAVLLLTLVVGMWSVFSKYAKQKKWFDSLVNGPWQTMSGMIETGVWDAPQKSKSKHPNSFNRVISLKE